MNLVANSALYLSLAILALLVLRAVGRLVRDAVGMKVTCYQVGATKVTRCELGSMKLLIEDKRS